MRKIIWLSCVFCGLFFINIAAISQPKNPGYLEPGIRDMVLIYQGGVHRMDWNADQLRPYVVHENRHGKRDWFFDGFLFLEFDSGKGFSFELRASAPLAKKEDWEWLAGRHFEQDKGISALNQCIGEETGKLGAPSFKHKVVIGLPEPPIGQTDWGILNNKQLDFNNDSDRIEACKWYIDLLYDLYNRMNYSNIELAGFYWISEKALKSKNLTKAVSKYIHEKNKLFYWIPYYTAQGYSEWKDFGFDAAYLQPTYFWNKRIKDNRVDRACQLAYTHNMGLEMEFDMAASVNSKNKLRDRGMKYMESFKRNGVYKSGAIAYYEGGSGIYQFSKATERLDKEFIDTLAYFVQERRRRMVEGINPDYHESFSSKALNPDKWNISAGSDKNLTYKKDIICLKGKTIIDTRKKADMKYGRIEVRAKIVSNNPKAKAMIRMMPSEKKLGEWPKSGDMFLMQYDGTMGDRVKCGVNTMQMNVNLNNIKQSVVSVDKLNKEYHTFVCEWTKDDIIFKIDGIIVNIQEDLFESKYSYYPQGWPFNNEPYYLEISSESPDNKPVICIDSVTMEYD